MAPEAKPFAFRRALPERIRHARSPITPTSVLEARVRVSERLFGLSRNLKAIDE
jgi:hypothetical protein